jgi:cation diffusion facilitator family transporter
MRVADTRGHDEEGHRRDANRAIAVSAVGLALTGGLELLLAVFTGSVALLGDALHNLSDVSTSAVVFLGFRISKRPPSAAYPYGYERAEDLAGLGVALVIWLSAVFAGYQSYLKFVRNAGTSHIAIGIAGAAVGILGNQLVAYYKGSVGRRIQSATLQADAKHSWLDALSSLGALIGLLIVATGRRWGDPIAGFVVTLFIVQVGFTVSREIIHHLMDGVDAADLQAARDAVLRVEGIMDVTVRGRWMGRSLVIDIEARLNPDISLKTAEGVGSRARSAVFDAVPSARRINWIPRA